MMDDDIGGGDIRSTIVNAVAESTGAAPSPSSTSSPGSSSGYGEAGTGGSAGPQSTDSRAADSRPGDSRTSDNRATDSRTGAAGERRPPGGERATHGDRGASGPGETPQHWSAADRETFNALPPAAQRPFLDLYRRMEGGLGQKVQRGADLERDYGELDQVFAPHREELRQKGMAPRDVIRAWHSVERELGSQHKNLVAARIIAGYGCDPVEVARHLNEMRRGQGAAPHTGGGNPAASGDPQMVARLQHLEQRELNRHTAEAAARIGDMQRRIDSFRDEKDASGRLLRPHFAALENDMMQLAQFDRANGKTPELADLYTRAVWGNQETREAELVARGGNGDAAARRQKAEAARRAGSSVGGNRPNNLNGAGSSSGSVRDDLLAAMRG